VNELKAQYQTLEKSFSTLRGKFFNLQKEIEDLEGTRLIYDIANVNEGRLTLETGVAFSTTDQSNKSTIYYTPYKGGTVALYSGSIWKVYPFTELSIALSGLTAGKNYDVFVYDNSGTVTLELSAAWTSDTARSSALVLQDGVYVKSGATTRRYLGTFRATSATQTQDTKSQRFIWNYQNRLAKYFYVFDSTNTWTYNVASWRAANGSASNKIEFVIGLDDVMVESRALEIITNGTGTLAYHATGIGIDSTTTNSAQLRGSGSDNNVVNQCWAEYRGYPGLGYHYFQWLENGHTSTITVWGDNADGTRYQSGLVGELDG
jgi:hypothetical protein